MAGRKSEIVCAGLKGSGRAYLAARLREELGRPLVIVAPSAPDAETLVQDMEFFLKSRVAFFPPYNISPYKRVEFHSETAGRRVRTLYEMMEGADGVVVTTVEGLLKKLIPKHALSGFAEPAEAGEEMDREALSARLVAGGYSHVSMVEDPGDFSVRGGIVDIYSPLYDDPLRMEFFGDMVESMRFFSAATQKKKKDVHEAVILPAREVAFEPGSRDGFVRRMKKLGRSAGVPAKKMVRMAERFKKEGFFPGIENFLPLLYEKPGIFLDYIPQDALVIFMDREEIEDQARRLGERIKKERLEAVESRVPAPEPGDLFLEWEEALRILSPSRPLSVRSFSMTGSMPDADAPPEFDFSVRDNAALGEALKFSRSKDTPFAPLAKWINGHLETGLKIVLASGSGRRTEAARSLLEGYGVPLRPADGFPEAMKARGGVAAATGNLSAGFAWPGEAAVITDAEIFGSGAKRKTRRKRSPGSALLKTGDLKTGDLVVHADHGVGRYQGLVKLEVERVFGDYLLIVYRDDDRLYLPVERIGAARRYMGAEGAEPPLDKLGGPSWDRVRKKVKKAARKIAGDLLKLYARRKVARGRAFKDSDGDMERFEAGFEYEETPDQRRAIEDVFHDMARPLPMDRLVCGDVGYGKTEVALRAAFLAAWNGHQIALMVPTTVLAHQHFETFKARFKEFPIRIECLSRFVGARKGKDIIEGVTNGAVDIVIGTHRLLSGDVAFKRLGLLILDEEQRFGVKHKEKLKSLREAVDVLTLTATPIPRTLHLSLTGMRDISVISTPPELRRPIITYICEWEDRVIAGAIQKELARGGQIFFLHNNISSIWNMADHLSRLVPEVRLGVAHSRLGSDKLENVMMDFFNRKLDMLVCTTIVEAGLDIPAANTIFINRADRFGLAQMYQLRGRVGRSGEQAYAFLFVPDESLLSKDAKKRMKALMDHSELGAGFEIAMSDLRIRGGGSILGADQSGHIAAVGYDMFLKLMEQAVSELKGEAAAEPLDPEVSVPLSALLPESYIPDIDQRLRAYRRMSEMTRLKDLAGFKNELTDRFGAMPEEVENLLMKMALRVMCVRAGVKKLKLEKNILSLYFSSAHQENIPGVADMDESGLGVFEIIPGHFLKARLKKRPVRGSVMDIKNILKEIARRVSI